MTPLGPCMLDTHAASALIRGNAHPVLLAAMTEQRVCLSVITEAELRYGVRRRPEANRLARAVDTFLQALPIVPWTSSTAATFAELRTRMEAHGVSLAAMDLLIATQAVAEGCTLITADRAFAHVPGLRTFDWSAGNTPAHEPAG